MHATPAYMAFVSSSAAAEQGTLRSYRVNADGGELEPLATTTAGKNLGFLAVHPSGEYLYAVDEVTDGAVVAVSVDRKTGDLSRIDRQASGGDGPCHCSVDATGRYVLVAHYVGGSVSLLPIRDDGRLDPVADVVEHVGKSVDPERQTRPHPHSITPGPENRFVYVPDLGVDRVFTYELDHEHGTLRPASPPHVSLHERAGPRHVDTHPNGRVLYLLNELDATLTTFERDRRTGALEAAETIPTLPTGFDGENLAADVHVHPTGRWVYVSNRGHDSIAIVEVDGEGGQARIVGHESTRGTYPRNFAIDPTGSSLFAANRESDTVVGFRIDDENGTLEYTGHTIEVPSPSCMKVIQAE